MTVEKSMLLISSFRDGAPTFRMMPLTKDCPYGEVVYVPQAKALVVFHKHTVEGLHMVPKLDDNGDSVRALKPRADGNPYKQERKTLTTPHESYLTDKSEIEMFVSMFGYNSEFDYKRFMIEPKAAPESLIQTIETPKIILPN
jgi:hypothetical protein